MKMYTNRGGVCNEDVTLTEEGSVLRMYTNRGGVFNEDVH
jgi:hypothetical protein